MGVVRKSERRSGSFSSDPRDRLIAVARQHFLSHGFRGVTMDDLARDLGISKKTVYQLFPSKTELVEAVIAAKFAEMNADLTEATTCRDSNFLAALHQMLAMVQHHAGEIQPSFVRDVRRSVPELFQQIEMRRTELVRRHFGRLFAEGRRAGMIRKDIPARLAIAILLGAVQGVVNPEGIAKLHITPKAAVSAVITVVLEGLLTHRGRSKK